MGMNDLNEALAQLEAVGLIKAFGRTDSMGDVVVLELQPTLTPAQFIKDDLLSVQLLQMVGPDQFKELSQKASANYLDVSNLQNVSRQFFDVFHPDQHEQTTHDPVITHAQKQISGLTDQRVDSRTVVSDQDFDFHFLAQQLAGAGIDTDIIQQYRRLILVEHQTYGYDEMQIAQFIQRAVNVVDNSFDPEQFKIAARQADQSISQPQTSNANSTKVHNLDLAGLSDEVQSLIRHCESLVPIDFLHQLKQQTGGYVTSSERHIVERLVTEGRLSNGAVNLLLWYIIGEQGLATLKANLADTIANNWIRAGVHSSVDAWNEIQHHQQARLDRQQNHYRRSSKRRGTVKENLPEWAKKGHQPQYHKASAEEVAKSKRALAELRAMKNKRQPKEGDH